MTSNLVSSLPGTQQQEDTCNNKLLVNTENDDDDDSSLTKLRLEQQILNNTNDDMNEERRCYENIINVLVQAKEVSAYPFLEELEFRYLNICNEVFANLILDLIQTRTYCQISFVRCSGEYFEFLIIELAKKKCLVRHCQRLFMNHNHLSYTSCAALGNALGDANNARDNNNPKNDDDDEKSKNKNTRLYSLQLNRERLFGRNTTAVLQGFYHNTTLSELTLNFCRFHDDHSITALCQCLEQNRSIQKLDLGACYLRDDQVACLISPLMDGHPLKNLTLTLNACHDKGIEALSQWLSQSTINQDEGQQRQCQLEYLDLSHQKEYRRTMCSLKPLAEALKVNVTLKALKLIRNRLDSNDIEPLLDVLQVNSTLEDLDISYNTIGDEGIQRIAESVYRMKGLRKISLLSNDIDLDASVLLLSESIKFNQHIESVQIRPITKCTLLAQHVTHNIQFYTALNWAGRKLIGSTESVPLALWPIVLERAQNNTNKTGAYTPDILYNFVREAHMWQCL